MLDNILVAVDGSPAADAALTHAIHRARRESARLTVVTAEAPIPSLAELAAHAYAGVADLLTARRFEAEAILERARSRVPDDVPVTTYVSTRRPCSSHPITAPLAFQKETSCSTTSSSPSTARTTPIGL